MLKSYETLWKNCSIHRHAAKYKPPHDRRIALPNNVLFCSTVGE